MPEPVVEVIGVYAADGGILGEVAYVVGHLLGRTECGLCDVTHGAVRRKPEWDDMAARLPVPLRLAHRNETTEGERTAYAASGLPAVLGERTSWCEFKGAAAYHDVLGGDAVARHAAWSYPRPSRGFESLRGRVAVMPGAVDRCTVDGEVVTPQAGGFYGGWVTSRVVGPFKGAPGTSG